MVVVKRSHLKVGLKRVNVVHVNTFPLCYRPVSCIKCKITQMRVSLAMPGDNVQSDAILATNMSSQPRPAVLATDSVIQNQHDIINNL